MIEQGTLLDYFCARYEKLKTNHSAKHQVDYVRHDCSLKTKKWSLTYAQNVATRLG